MVRSFFFSSNKYISLGEAGLEGFHRRPVGRMRRQGWRRKMKPAARIQGRTGGDVEERSRQKLKHIKMPFGMKGKHFHNT